MRVLLTRTALAEGERPARGGGDPASVGAVGDRVDASRGRLQGQALGMAGPIDVVPLPAAALARAAVEQVLGPSRTSCAHSRCPVRRRCSSSSLSISLLSASRSDGLFSESLCENSGFRLFFSGFLDFSHRLLRNPLPELLHQPHPEEVLHRRVDGFVEQLGLDRERILSWNFAQAILSAWWAYDPHGTGWRTILAYAELAAQLLGR